LKKELDMSKHTMIMCGFAIFATSAQCASSASGDDPELGKGCTNVANLSRAIDYNNFR
jgi:hypothetical protein